MPRANRSHLTGQVVHITHRCHQGRFLFRFARDRRAWVHWLFEARKRFSLCALNYQVTHNHIHLLALDRGLGEIASSMQLVAGQTAQEYNLRKHRHGAFWEDRYHATIVDSAAYLLRCLVYIDLNMVRAGVVTHPRNWREAGYHEIQQRRDRYRIVDRAKLSELLETTEADLAALHEQSLTESMLTRACAREPAWSTAVAVGGRAFTEDIRHRFALRARYRRVEEADGLCILRDSVARYASHSKGQKPLLSPLDLSDYRETLFVPSA